MLWGWVMAIPTWLSFCCRRHFCCLAVRLAKLLQPSCPTHGVRRQQSDAVCILSPVMHLPMGDSRIPSCFSTGPQDIVPLFPQRIGPHFTFILQSQKQNKKTQSPTYLKRIPEKTDGYKSDMANKKILLSAMTVVMAHGWEWEWKYNCYRYSYARVHADCKLFPSPGLWTFLSKAAVLGRPVIIQWHRLLLVLSPWKDSTGIKVFPKPIQGHECKFSVLKIIQFMKYSPPFG